MATLITELALGQYADDSEQGLRLVRSFHVRTIGGETQADAIYARRVPRRHDTLYVAEAGISVVCRRVIARPRNSEKFDWLVQAEYTVDAPVPPAESDLEIAIGALTASEVVETDGPDGPPIRNTLGVPIDPTALPEREISYPVLRIRRSETNNPASKARRYSNTTNEFPVRILGTAYERQQLKMQPITATWSTRSGARIWRVNYDIVLGYPTTFRVLNAGWRAKFDQENPGPDPFVVREITDDEGNTLSEPSLLDEAGFVLPPGDEPVFLPTDGREGFPRYEERDFAALNLPAELPQSQP